MMDSISISDMARMHGITRQTLIYYDNIDLFKPNRVDANGYRYYSWSQIPQLREICFLRKIGVPLKEIIDHFQNRSPAREEKLLFDHKRKLEEKIGELQKLREMLIIRMKTYEMAEEASAMKLYLRPFLTHLEKRKILFKPWYQPINKSNLHRTVMDLWQEMVSDTASPPCVFGTMLKRDSVLSGDILQGAGSIVFLPVLDEVHKDAIIVPEGEYACMYKYGMPYEEEHVRRFLHWLEGKGLELAGDIVDVCLLDTTFYQPGHETDFCMLQALVRKKEKNPCGKKHKS
ncbi:MAG: HTH merR-type domain-containing protein [Succiniclasticum sp.]|jgi:DNA-binding transcriptional MerR regulator